MLNNRKKIIIIIMTILLIIIISVIIFSLNYNKKLTCISKEEKKVMEFKRNKLVYVFGSIDITLKSQEEKQFINQTVELHNEFLTLNNDKLEYSMSYSKENEVVLNFVGFNLNNKNSYKAMKKDFESNNYICK